MSKSDEPEVVEIGYLFDIPAMPAAVQLAIDELDAIYHSTTLNALHQLAHDTKNADLNWHLDAIEARLIALKEQLYDAYPD